MNKEIKSFVSTRASYDKRRHVCTLVPTHENCLLMLKAAFALSLAKVRLLRRVDTYGHLLLNAHKEVRIQKQALATYTNQDSSVQQMVLGI